VLNEKVASGSQIILVRVTRQLEKKISPNFSKNSPKSCQIKKGQNVCNKAQFESPKHLQQTNFETFKVAKLVKNRPIWSP